MLGEGVLRVEGITKTFGRTRALSDVSTAFLPGEVHAVLGENGAGKSTLMNVLAGFERADEGHITLDGAPLPLGQPAAMRRAGLAMVHQHFMLVPNFTVAENLALDRLDNLRGQPDPQAEQAQSIAQRLGWTLDLNARTGDLPVGVQQRLEILKALAANARILIFDEPTAVLTPDEADELLDLLRSLAAEGRTVILIAHKLSEVLPLAHRYTVLRRGKVVGRASAAEVDAALLTEWMVGETPPIAPQPSTSFGPTVVEAIQLAVKGNRGEPAVRGVSWTIRRGEILGIGGVDGNGQTELAEAVARLRPFTGQLTTPPKIAYIPPDRQAAGLALDLSIEDNLTIGHVQRQNPFWLRPSDLRNWARHVVARYDIRIGHLPDEVRTLSGGNQQKVVVGRELAETPDLLVVVNPTRGLDIRATAFVREQIRAAAEQGAAVLLISTDSDELAELATRTLYLSRGQLSHELLGAS